MNSLIAVDWFGNFRYVFPARPGSENDSGMYLRSDLWQDRHNRFSPGEGLLADGGFYNNCTFAPGTSGGFFEMMCV